MSKKISKDDYLQCRDRVGRIAILEQMAEHGAGIPVSLAEDLLKLDLSHLEKIALIRATASSSALRLEDFYSKHIVGFQQDVAVQALRSWSEHCEGVLWYRLIPILNHSSITNRVRYTILDIAPKIGGRSIVENCLKDPSIETQSPAYHALLLQRALQYGISHENALSLSKKILHHSKFELHPQNKALMASMIYLEVFDKQDLIHGNFNEASVDAFVREFVYRCIRKEDSTRLKSKKEINKAMLTGYVSFSERVQLTSEQAMEYLGSRNLESFASQDFAGIKSSVLEDMIRKFEGEDEDLVRILKLCLPWMRNPYSDRFLEIVRERLSKVSNLTKVLQAFPGDLNLLLSAGSNKNTSKDVYGVIFREQNDLFLKNDFGPRVPFFEKLDIPYSEKPELCENIQDSKDRRRVLDCFYSEASSSAVLKPQQDARSYWDLLEAAWRSSDVRTLEKLSTEARKQPPLYQLIYLHCLGRFVGSDEASLKVLDFVRSEHEDELRFAFKSLRKINTSRALQELVHALGRPNVGVKLQAEIATLLVGADLHKLQNELRVAVNDLKLQPDRNSERWDLFETLESLLVTTDIESSKVKLSTAIAAKNSSFGAEEVSMDMDLKLKQKIVGVEKLSSEARRALRTAMYFYEVTKTKMDAKNNIDLSPVVDMQYKALELSFRETFEQLVTDVLNRSQISHKLDAIGYARPIPAKMDEFENYLANLPIIKEIPFFSKFKLRKLLRSICQFQPGRRFTLDGLKAFALFFLCFSRDRCEFGLQNSFPIGLSSNEELFYFVSQLHILQDMRNRAAHEGFQPDARNDIEAIWKTTANLVDILLRIRERKVESNSSGHKPLGMAG